MRKIPLIALFLLVTFSLFSQVKVVKFQALENYICEKSGAKIKVINFWATWCGPCIKELPYFDAIDRQYPNEKVEVLLVSLDFADQLEKVENFLERKSISSKVWLLDESDANSYIDLVDTRWSGAIPMTLLINSTTGKRIFLERELTQQELKHHLNLLLN